MVTMKPYSYVAATQDKKAIKRASILELIRHDGPISRSQIAARLHLSLPAVRRFTDDLSVSGWIYDVEGKALSGGRKYTRLGFSGSDHLVVGIDLGGTKIYGALVDFDGKILYEMNYEHHQSQAEESLGVVCHVIDELLGVAAQGDVPVHGIGIGVPGITIPETGVVSLAPALDWQGFPLRQRLNERYPYTVIVENDVNLAALGEAWFGRKDRVEKSLVLIAIGTGIGAGVIINGSIYAGTHNMAGEIGYLLLDRNHLGHEYPGFGAFEQVASGTGIADRARGIFSDQIDSKAKDAVNAEFVFASARRHEKWAETVLADTIDYLAQAVAAVTLLYDPEVILLGGGVSRSADLLIEPILKRLKGTIPILPTLRVSQLGFRGAVLGAVEQLLKVTTDLFSN
jgi:glucokinase